MHIYLCIKYLLFLSYFKETWIFSTDFRKILKGQISWKSVSVAVEIFHADGRTERDMAMLIAAFRKICETRLKMWRVNPVIVHNWKAYGESWSMALLTLALDGGEWLALEKTEFSWPCRDSNKVSVLSVPSLISIQTCCPGFPWICIRSRN